MIFLSPRQPPAVPISIAPELLTPGLSLFMGHSKMLLYTLEYISREGVSCLFLPTKEAALSEFEKLKSHTLMITLNKLKFSNTKEGICSLLNNGGTGLSYEQILLWDGEMGGSRK